MSELKMKKNQPILMGQWRPLRSTTKIWNQSFQLITGILERLRLTSGLLLVQKPEEEEEEEGQMGEKL